MKEKYNIHKIYLYNLFHSLIFAYVVERLFWESRGISIKEVVYIEIIYSIMIIVLEIPTGMLADRFSRKNLIVVDAILSLLEIVIIIFAQSFYQFAFAICLSAIGHALQSGAHNALVYDTLKLQKKTNHFEKVLSRIKAIDYTGSMISGVIGGLVATKFQNITTYKLSFISLLVAFIIALTLQEVKSQDKIKHKRAKWTKHDWSKIYRFMLKRSDIRYIIFIGIISSGAIVYLQEFWQIYARDVGITVSYFGLINILGFTAVSIGSLMASKIKDRYGLNKGVKYNTILCMVGFLALSVNHEWYGIFMIALIYFSSAIIEPLTYGYLHHHAIEKYRATIESVYSCLSKLPVAIIGLPFGYLSTRYSIFAGFWYISVVLIILTCIIFISKKNMDKVELED
ncbi:MFS transporter [Clostridiaceae bacterium M8S5]|nr:MFS transporter [Clostridiaceae bacterium M8S5]